MNAHQHGEFDVIEQAAKELLFKELPEKTNLVSEVLQVRFWHREMDRFNEYGLARQD